MSEIAATVRRRIPGEAGIWVFVLGDMTMFAAFFGQFVADRATHLDVFDASQAHAHITFGAVNTMLLLTGSLFVVWAVQAVRIEDLPIARRWFSCALGCGSLFLVDKVIEYADKLGHGTTPGTNLYFTYFFMYTGIHALHLIFGLGVLAHLRRLCGLEQLDGRQRRTIEIGATYWHLVDLLWVVLFALLYLMA